MRIRFQGVVIACGLFAAGYVVWWSLHDLGARMADVRGRWCVDAEATRPLLEDAVGGGGSAAARKASVDATLGRWMDVVVTISGDEIRFDASGREGNPIPATVKLSRNDFIALRLGEDRPVGLFIDGDHLTWRESGLALVLRRKP